MWNPRETSFEALLRGIRGNIQNYWVCSTDVCDPLPVSSPRQTEDDLKVKSGIFRYTIDNERRIIKLYGKIIFFMCDSAMVYFLNK